jgi:hypothetical protein
MHAASDHLTALYRCNFEKHEGVTRMVLSVTRVGCGSLRLSPTELQ